MGNEKKKTNLIGNVTLLFIINKSKFSLQNMYKLIQSETVCVMSYKSIYVCVKNTFTFDFLDGAIILKTKKGGL